MGAIELRKCEMQPAVSDQGWMHFFRWAFVAHLNGVWPCDATEDPSAIGPKATGSIACDLLNADGHSIVVPSFLCP
jgi:hypothetical protein